MSGSDYPYYGWGASDDDITGDGGSTQVNPGMQAAANATKWGAMPPSFDLLLGSHIHLAQITTFEDSESGQKNPPQLVVGNSGTQFVAPTAPLETFGDESKGLPKIKVKDTYTMYQYGYVLVTKTKGARLGNKRGDDGAGTGNKGGDTGDSWMLDFKDQTGRNMLRCNLYLKDVDCDDMLEDDEAKQYEASDGSSCAKKKQKKCRDPCVWEDSECMDPNVQGASLKGNIDVADPIEDQASIATSVNTTPSLLLVMPFLLMAFW